ncbi:hypothetical protein DY000_02010955 [Brassica cretica]|uniref:Uncharacterized protein n=1 Tax=Brassica cretica TaxID=69181 RepID=A0ABQ7CXS1_BRACR|nr:hypothetical protein DY000_02010955 [Brassica cretica]
MVNTMFDPRNVPDATDMLVCQATINWRPRHVRDLTRIFSNGTKVLNVKNKDGLRPLDIAKVKIYIPTTSFRDV